MKAVVVNELAGPSALRIEELAMPVMGPGQILVRLHAAAINFPDVLMTTGGYQHKPSLPFIIGREGAGEVVASNLPAFQPGDRVIVCHRNGLFAEYCLAEENQIYPLPAAFDFAAGAAYMVCGLTAYNALVVRGELRSGETLLVHGATGGVGMATVKLGRHLGARVIATGGDDEKLAVVKAAGAEHVINYRRQDFREIVKQMTQGAGADVIADTVGGEVFEQSMRCINWNGRLLVLGFTSGGYGSLKANYPLLKGCRVIGCRAGEWGKRAPEVGAAQRAAVMALADVATLRPHISHRVRFHDVKDLFALLQDRKVVGKAVLEFDVDP